MKKLKYSLSIVSIFFTIGFVNAASFDCSKAGTLIEHSICGDAELSKLDEDLAKVYKNAKKYTDKKVLKKEQIGWLKEKRGNCSDLQCLRSVYTQRIEQLNKYNTFDSNNTFIGNWSEGIGDYTQDIFIKNSNSESFDFDLSSFAKMNLGEITGTAQIFQSNNNKAIFKGEENCSLTFELKKTILQIDATDGCSYFGGLNVTFGGDFNRLNKEKENTNINVKDEIVINDKAKKEAVRFANLSPREIKRIKVKEFLGNESTYLDTDRMNLNLKVSSGKLSYVNKWNVRNYVFYTSGDNPKVCLLIQVNDRDERYFLINNKKVSLKQDSSNGYIPKDGGNTFGNTTYSGVENNISSNSLIFDDKIFSL